MFGEILQTAQKKVVYKTYLSELQEYVSVHTCNSDKNYKLIVSIGTSMITLHLWSLFWQFDLDQCVVQGPQFSK